MTSLEDTLKFLSLPNSCPLCIVVLNPKTGQPISVNSTFESIFGPIYKFKEWEFANAASGDDISPEEGTKKIDESNINREKFREAIDMVRSSLSSSDPTSSSNDNGDNKKESSTKIRNVEMLTLGTNDAGLPVRKYFDWTIGSVNMQQPITFDDNDNTSHITSAVILYGDMVNEEESSDRARDAELIDFLQNAPIAMHWLNGDGTVLWANQTELNVLGYTAEEYIGQPIMNFCPDEKELVLEIFKQLGSGNAIADVPVRFRTKDGKLVHLLIDSNVAYNKDGSFGHTRCFIRDDTARKIRDARSKLLLEETERSLRMLDGFLSRTLHHVMGPLHALRSTCEVVRDNLGSINTSNDESVQNCDLLERAAETVMTTTRMVADVSDLARLDEGSVLKTKFDSVDIRDVGLEAIESIQFNSLRLSGGDDGISVSLNLIGDGGPSNVRTDRTVLLRVLAHLLENAVREVDSGGKVILQIKSVGTSSSRVPGVFVEVIDDGKGLPAGTCLDKGGNLKNAPSNRYVTGNLKLSSQDPDQIQKARMEMERELQDLKQNGVGVGLPLSYHLVNALGGELRYDTSYAGKGTRVWFVLPESSMEADDKATLLKTENIPKKGGRPPANIVINIEEEQASKRRRISENKFSTFVSSDGSHSSGRDDDTFATSLSHKPAPEAVAKCGVKASMPFSVLIVEDTDICARLLAMQLKKMKCSTQRAENGQVAVDLLKSSLEGTFDLVLMDLRMPVMDGLEATKLIRNELQMGDLPIVALTGEMSADIKSECESIGFNSFYQKPLKKDKLQEIIKMYKTSRDEGEDKE